MTTAEVFRELTSGKPVSLIRCGDGEKIVLDGFEHYGTFNSILKRQMGFSPPIEHAEKIRENLISAIDGADIVGVPRHKKLERMGEHWIKAEATMDKFCPNMTKHRCSLDVHYDFLNNGLYHQWLTGMPFAYVGCRDLVEGFKKEFKTQWVKWYPIAPEAKYTSYTGRPHYPDQFERIERWMDLCNPKNKVLLVGAGIIGKIYCNWWRDRGGVAMDVGSVMDEWAGRVTRGPDRFLDKVEANKYTLPGII